MAVDEFGIDWGAGDSVEHKPDVSGVQVEPQTPTPPQGETGFVEDVLVHGIAGGVEQAGRGVYSTVKAGADALGADLPDLGQPMVGEAEGITSQIVRDVTQFGLGFVGGMNLLKIGGVASKMAPVAKEILASGLGTGVVADPTAPRLSNLIQKYPWLENPVTEYLQQDDADGVAESKFKSALEDMMVTPAAMVLFKTVKGLKNALKGNDAEAGKLVDEVVQDAKGVNYDNPLEVPEVTVTPENAAPVKKTAAELFTLPEQEISSAATSINSGKLPAVFGKMEKGDYFVDGGVNLDIGGGRFDNATEALSKHNVKNYIYDPFNRTTEQNKVAIDAATDGKADTVTVSNVLNVIKEEGNQRTVLEQAENALKPGGRVFITVYEGKGDGVSAATKAGFQQNKKTADYLDLVKQVFPEAEVKNGMIIATKGDSVHPTSSASGLKVGVANTVEVKTASGRTVFTLTKDEEKAFDAHLNHLVSNDHLEDVFNFPAFKSFNDAKSDALPDTKEVLDSLVQYVKPKLDKFMHGEVRSHSEVEKFADLLQEDSKALYARMQQTVKSMADLDATITAAKGLTYSLAREARRLAIKGHHGTATAEDKAALMLAEKRLTDVFGMTLAIRKGAARATSAGNITTGESDLAGKITEAGLKAGGDADELIRLLALTENEKEVLGILKPKSLMGKLIDAHNEVWINGILSGVKTHVVNLTSASVNTLLTPANQIVGGVLTRNPQEIREGFALYRGLSRHIFDSLEMARRSFKTERAILDPGKSTDESIEKAISGKNFESLGRFADWLGTVVRIPGRFLKAEDEFFKQMNYRAKVEATASREAADLVAAGKLDPKKMVDYTDGEKTIQINEVEQYIREKFKSAFSPAQVGMNKGAIDYSREITFTQDLNRIETYDWFGNPGARIQAFAAGHPWLRGAVLPFIKVPTNLMRAAGDLTPPIAALKREGMDIITGKDKDPHRAAMFYGRLSTGGMLWTGAGMLALQGRITGAAYGDKDMRNRQMESGWQPYSFVFDGPDGKKEYVSYQRLDPFGMFFGLAADWAYISQHVDAESGHNWATMATLAVAKNLSSKSYLQGLVEWAAMLGGGYTADEQVKRMAQMRAASYLPNYMNLYTGNDELKEIRSITDAMMAKIPGLSSQVEAKRDYFGEKRVAPMGYPWNAIDPFPVSESKDAVRTELARLSRSQSEAKFTMPDTKLGNMDLTNPAFRNAKGQTPYDRWTELIGQVEIGGKTFHQKLEETIGSFRYQEGTDGTSAYHNGNRIVMIKNQQEKYREKALREMLKEFEGEHQAGTLKDNVRDMIRQDKRNERAVTHGRVDDIRDLLNLNQ